MQVRLLPVIAAIDGLHDHFDDFLLALDLERNGCAGSADRPYGAEQTREVGWAHAAGLSVTPYTFRSAGQPAGRSVRDEMDTFLYTLGVDAVFTDNPDQFPRMSRDTR